MAASGPAYALGEEIRRQREANHMSMRQFAAMSGISNPYLSQIERGLRASWHRVLDAIARALEMSIDELYAEAGVVPTPAPVHSDVCSALESDPRRVIAEPCISNKDASCVATCPVDCDACVEACPSEAVFADHHLPGEWENYVQLNADYFSR